MKTVRNFLIGCVAVVALIVLGFYFFNNSEDNVHGKNVSFVPSSFKNVEDKLEVKEPSNPLLDGFDAPDVKKGKVTVDFSDKKFTSSNGSSLSVEKSTISTPNIECSIVNTTDFCLVGNVSSEKNTYDVYFMKDAAHSRLFENVENFKPLNIDNTSVAGVFPLKSSGELFDTIVVVNKDSSGWMIIVKKGEPDSVLNEITFNIS